MWITRTSINQPVFATMVMLALVVLGAFSYRLLPGRADARGQPADGVGHGAVSRRLARGDRERRHQADGERHQHRRWREEHLRDRARRRCVSCRSTSAWTWTSWPPRRRCATRWRRFARRCRARLRSRRSRARATTAPCSPSSASSSTRRRARCAKSRRSSISRSSSACRIRTASATSSSAARSSGRCRSSCVRSSCRATASASIR